MKKYIISAILLFSFVSGYAQLTTSDLRSGKHIHSALNGDINGAWVSKSPGNSFEIRIKKDVKHYQKNSVDIKFDNLFISVTKLIINGRDLSSNFTNDIELLVSPNSPKDFFGKYSDPVTNTRVIITLKQINDKSFNLTVTFPEMSYDNDLSKGTILPKFSTFSR